MIHLKNHKSGFMLIETLFAIVIISMMMTPLFTLQSSAMKAVARFSQKLALIFEMKKKLDDPQIKLQNSTIKFSSKPISKTSSLKKMENLFIEKVEGTTKGNHTESIIFFRYKPKKQKGSQL